MAFSYIFDIVSYVYTEYCTKNEPLGYIRFLKRSKVKELRDQATLLILNVFQKWNKYYKLLNFYSKLVSKQKNQDFTLNQYILLAPLLKYQVIAILQEKLEVINWFLHYSDKSVRNFKLRSYGIPKQCMLNQGQLETLVEDFRFLFLQAESILSYNEKDLKSLAIIMNQEYQLEVQNFIKKSLNKDERILYENLINSNVKDYDYNDSLFDYSLDYNVRYNYAHLSPDSINIKAIHVNLLNAFNKNNVPQNALLFSPNQPCLEEFKTQASPRYSNDFYNDYDNNIELSENSDLNNSQQIDDVEITDFEQDDFSLELYRETRGKQVNQLISDLCTFVIKEEVEYD